MLHRLEHPPPLPPVYVCAMRASAVRKNPTYRVHIGMADYPADVLIARMVLLLHLDHTHSRIRISTAIAMSRFPRSGYFFNDAR